MAINHSFGYLNKDWYYRHTRFTVDQLRILHRYLDFPPLFFIHEGRAHCTSEEGFIIMVVKIATGFSNTKLCDLFGGPNHQQINDIYCFNVALLDSTAEGFLHGETSLEQCVHHFVHFAGMIEQKLAEKAVGGLLFDNFCIIGVADCKINETCHPGSGPAEGRPLSPRYDILHESVYSGYTKSHGLKSFNCDAPKWSYRLPLRSY
jgi:hypothetical protein